MDNIIDTKILGKWDITVDTPFGKEQYTLSLDSIDGNLSGFVSHEKGNANLTNGSFQDETLNCSLDVEFPIKATVNLQASLIDADKLFGTLQIDQYLQTLFIGVRS